MTDSDTALQVPAQEIPVPQSLSPQARGFLGAAARRIAARTADRAAAVSTQDAAALTFLRPAAARFQGTFATVDLAHGAALYRATPDGRQGRHAEVGYFDIHGGGDGGPLAYAGGAELQQPYLSPLFGDFSKGWPPTMLTSGTRDLLLSDTVRMHRRLREAGVDAQLHVTEAGPHGGFMGTAPEDHYIIGECRRFMYRAWGIGTPGTTGMAGAVAGKPIAMPADQ